MPFHRPTAERTVKQALDVIERSNHEKFTVYIVIDQDSASYTIESDE